MLASEKLIIKQFNVDLKSDVIPIEVLPYLLCLNDDDCEQIRYKQDREGPRAAVPILLDRLMKRPGAFEQFLDALGETGCSHLKTLLQNAARDQTHLPEPEHNRNMMTPETTSNDSENLRTPTKETVRPFTPPETKQSLKSTTSKKSHKKQKKLKIPRENTTSPPTIKSKSVHTNETNPPHVKLVKATKNTTNTPPKKGSVSQRITKSSQTKEVSTTDPSCTQSSAKTDTTPNSQPSEIDFIEKSKSQFDTLVCYAKENQKIALELKDFLQTNCNLQVCIDLVNFMPGKAITDNICESINSSQSIVFLLSPEFLKKFWAGFELKNAVYDSNASQKYHGKYKKIIPVLLEECQVPNELKIFTAIKMKESGSKNDCWKKLAAAILDREHVGDVVVGDDVVEDDVDVDDINDDNDNNDGVCKDDSDQDDGSQDDHNSVEYGDDDDGGSDDDLDNDCTGDDNGGIDDNVDDNVDDKDGSDDAVQSSDDDGSHTDCVDDGHDEGGDDRDCRDSVAGDDAVDHNGDNVEDKCDDLDYDDSGNDDGESDDSDESDDGDKVDDNKNNDGDNEKKSDADNEKKTDVDENKTDSAYDNIKSL